MLYLIIFLCVLISGQLSASDNNAVLTPQAVMEKQLDAVDFKELEEFVKQVDQEVGRYLKDISLKGIIENFKKGQLDLSPQEALESVFQYFFQEILGNLTLLGKLLIVAVVCVVLQNLQSAFANGTVAKLAYFVCYLVVITLAVGSFKVAVNTGISTVDKMVDFMQVLLPILLALLTAMGGLTSVALLQPFLMVSLSVMATLIQKIIFPLIFLCAVLSIANNVSDRYKVSRLAGLLKQFTKVGIGLVLTIFIGIVTVEGVAGAVVDGVSLRTAKFVTGAFVPVAGSMFADALDAVIGGSLLLKNAIGLTGVLVLSLLVLFPVLKILAVAIIYRLAAALLQPLGDSLMADTLEDMAGSLFMVFAAVTSVAIMFFLTITIIVGAANFTVMLR